MIIQWLLVSTAHFCPLQLNVPSLYRIQTAPYTKYKHAILTQNTNTPSLHRIQRQTAPYAEYKDKCAILTQNTKTNSPLHRIQTCHPYTEYKDKQPFTQNTKTARTTNNFLMGLMEPLPQALLSASNHWIWKAAHGGEKLLHNHKLELK